MCEGDNMASVVFPFNAELTIMHLCIFFTRRNFVKLQEFHNNSFY